MNKDTFVLRVGPFYFWPFYFALSMVVVYVLDIPNDRWISFWIGAFMFGGTLHLVLNLFSKKLARIIRAIEGDNRRLETQVSYLEEELSDLKDVNNTLLERMMNND